VTAAAYDTAVISTTPTISIDGQVSDPVNQSLLSLEVIDSVEGLSRCEINIGNTGFTFFDRRTLDFGKTVQVKFGPPGSEGVVFDGSISALEGQFPNGEQAYITLLVEDRFNKLRMTRRTRTFENVTDQDIFRSIANAHGLTPSLQFSGPSHKALAQVNQSDLAFLRERARTLDVELWIEERTLHAAARAQRSSTTIPFSHPGTLREFSVLADLAHQCTALVVSGWDVGGKQAIRHEAGVSLVQGELNNGSSGASILQAKFSERKETVVHTIPQSSAEAQATAETLYRRTARQFVSGRGIVDPDPRLRVGVTVDLDGLGALFSGRYYVAGLRHLFDREMGLRSEIIVERPGLGQP
jgi:uncharacterized protein